MLGLLRLRKYVSSFVDGRVRLRHPALRQQQVADVAQKALSAVRGVHSVECNTLSGSVLIVYDSTILPRQRLLEVGEAWAAWLDAVQAGQNPQPPAM
ncbi:MULTISPECIES: HMA2 domain-containing protein [unclassified Desulfovibrio]|uniref:HMA2 domain-containing protein n=1 Tax=unclassified Desulfovibrio TaxID=2593640 RepID=UPI000F5FC24F|nr:MULTISPECIES: heavy-metal-associated domain-containing protein [unclassified Desulfovibrio]RRD69362.1 cation transporter [Desulfovibrio sp. OH1209_COT-279]RRD86069.1 cation transporter [Desulfovibrio sp. OH1186_COT-070]